MAQIGYEKVRTGCITCKQRRVKCDEAKPTCNRCRKAMKECRGYNIPMGVSYSWTQLLRTKPSIIPPTANGSLSLEMRSLDFFRLVVAPNISGPTTACLWTGPILQLSIQDVTARDAVLAISLLYEMSLEAHDRRAAGHSLKQRQKSAMASRYYSRSLGRVASAAATDLDAHLVLLFSILYMSVEFLRGHEASAIAHCRHALRIAQTSARPPSPDLVAVLSHLNVFPFFFGATLSDFPLWLYREGQPGQEPTEVYMLSASLDCLMVHTVGLIREFDPFRLNARGHDQDKDALTKEKSSLIARVHRLGQALDAWSLTFSKFKRSQQKTASKAETTAYRILEMRWLVINIWASCLGDVEETAYDAHQDGFERIIELAREDAKEKQGWSTSGAGGFGPVFRFDMGVLPLLHFVVIKCRILALRLEALMLLQGLACPQEALWNAPRTYAIGRRIVEREHGIEIASSECERLSEKFVFDAVAYTLPAENQRIKDSYLEPERVLCEDSSGAPMLRQVIIFFIQDDRKSEVIQVKDWIHFPMPPW